MGIFISLFGTGMNFAGVSLYVLGKTHSTVQVSFSVILLTLPRLVVPPFGGVLTDRVDRRYLSIALDLMRAVIVFTAAALAWRGALELWQIYVMVLLVGAGFAIYWSSSLALLQELIPVKQLVGANSAVLIAVQAGMLLAGALVGFIYERAGLAGILAIDGATYVVSAVLFYLLRRGYLSPRGRTTESSTELPAESECASVSILETIEPNPARGVLRDIEEGLHYLRTQPAVLALGLTYACMMAGVISANVIVVALASDLLHVGARGYGFIEAGWALGAVAGGFAAAKVSRRRPFTVMIASLFVLACGHALFPYAGFLAAAVAMNVAVWRVPRDCGGADAIVDSGGGSVEADGPHAIGFRGDGDGAAGGYEPGAGMAGAALEPADCVCDAGLAVRGGDCGRDAGSGSFRCAGHASSGGLIFLSVQKTRRRAPAGLAWLVIPPSNEQHQQLRAKGIRARSPRGRRAACASATGGAACAALWLRFGGCARG